jgi:hypothetical protein
MLSAAPLAIYALWRQRKLSQRLAELTELAAKQNDALHRELLDLKRQLAALPRAAAPPAEPHTEPSPEPTLRISAITPQPERPSSPPAVVLKPVAPTPPVPVAPVPVPPTATPVSAAPNVGAIGEPLKTPAAVPAPPVEQQPAGPTPTAPTTTKPPAEKPPAPAVPPQKPAPAQPPVIPPRPPRYVDVPNVPPQPPVTPPPAAARVAAPPQVAPLRSAAAHSTAQQRIKSVSAIEDALGRNWLNKIGIVLIVVGIAFFGILEFRQLTPVLKDVLLYAVSFAFLGGGIFVEKSDRYRVLGYTLIGGGWATLYFTTYALNHVVAMRVVQSEVLDLILMLAVAFAMVVHTLRYRSQLVTGLAFLLGYFTVTLSQDKVYSLSAGLILAIGLVSIVIRMGWYELEIFGILSSFLNHFYWLYRLLGPEGAQHQAFPDYHVSTLLLFFYWLTYRISYVVRKPKNPFEEHISTAAALLNTLLLLGVLKFQSVQPEQAWIALLIVGAMEFAFAQLPTVKRRREAFVVLTVLGAALMATAVPFHYTGNDVAILWLVGAEVFLIAGVVASEVVFRRLGLMIGLLVAIRLALFDFLPLMSLRRLNEDLLLNIGLIFGLCALVSYTNALLIGRRWPKFFQDSPDDLLLALHSYIGAFAAVCSVWALCSNDWTALAFAAIMLTLAAFQRKLRNLHLVVQYAGVIAPLTMFRVFAVNLHTEILLPAHVSMRLLTLPLLAAAFYLTAYLNDRSENSSGDVDLSVLRGLFSAAGTFLITALIYFEVPALWQPLAAIAFAVLLLEAGHRLAYRPLTWHTHAVAALAVFFAVTADPLAAHRWGTIPVHAFAALPVVVGAYWIAKRMRVVLPGGADQRNAELRNKDRQQARVAAIAYTWVAAGLVVWGLNEALSAAWIAVGWIIFAVALAHSTRWIRYRHLAWQADAVALLSIARTYTYNYAFDIDFWPHISVRLLTVVIVAAGLYSISRKPIRLNEPYARISPFLISAAGTALLALLAWYESPAGWLAAVWAAFALVLALVDRRFKLDELGWQAHALAALTMLQSVTVNLYVTDTWHGVSVRLLSLSIVALIFYALSYLVRLPQEWRQREFHHIYSWAASALVSLLVWYELPSLSVAVGWAVFGLLLFEYGLVRGIRQFRFQAYVALSAAFARIFFVNLTAGDPGNFWSDRTYTVLPIALIIFFVYSQLEADEKSAQDDQRLHFDELLACLGTGSIVALLYFEFTHVWVVTAWAVVVFILLGVSLWLERPGTDTKTDPKVDPKIDGLKIDSSKLVHRNPDRPIFLYQALLLAVGACARGIVHNLFGASYFTAGNWTGRYAVLGSAVAVLFLCLPFAFRLRDRYREKPPGGRIASLFGPVIKHPEQILFFAPVVLLTILLALQLRAGMVTVGWGIEGFLILLGAFAINERSFRLTGLILLLACFAKIVLIDMWRLEARDRYITLIMVGGAILLASFLYTRYSEKIRQYL